MCGIAGAISRETGDLRALVADMIRRIRYRGPDDTGIWSDEPAGMAFGHARLSIHDLSSAGHQPMVSSSGRYVATYNGEIYNFVELRDELQSYGRTFRGHSDTDVLLEAVEHWGFEASLARLNGMFACALWDRQARDLILVRDRLGEKPLYYGWSGKVLMFASELKAFKACPRFGAEVDRQALSLLLRHNCIPAPYSIYRDVAKLPPATYVRFSADEFSSGQWPRPVCYWSLGKQVEEGIADPFTGSEEEAVGALDRLLRKAVRLRMASDVPLGAFLSGGIDSSTVVALMQTESPTPVRTFTIGFHEAEYNEAGFAKQVADHLQTDHTELYVTPEQALAVIPNLASLYDEPFADSSQIPTFLLSEMAGRHVTVALSGDGGDELFGGYNRYFWGRTLRRRIGWIPSSLRPLVARSIRQLPLWFWNRLFNMSGGLLPSVRAPGEKLYKVADMLDYGDLDDLYCEFVSHWKDPSEIIVGGKEPPTLLSDRSAWPKLLDFTARMMFLDSVTYLPDDLLVKVDRASMAVALEARIPFLDHQIVEFAWRLPITFKIREKDQGKWIVRRLLERYVPAQLFERPKMGFGVPLDSWLRGPLREWAEALLDEHRLRREGFFHPNPIRRKWAEHLSGTANWQYHLWDVLMFQSWLESESIRSPSTDHPAS